MSERSIPALMQLSSQQQDLQLQLAQLETQRQKLQDEAMRLRPETIDADFVDEYSIKMLGHSRSQGLVIVDKQS